MTWIILAGAACGLGLLLLGLLLARPKPNPAATLAQLDVQRGRARQERITAASFDPRSVRDSRKLRQVGGQVRSSLDNFGLDLGGLRSDLSLMGRTLEGHLAISVLAALGGFVTPVLADVILIALGVGFAVPMSLALGVLLAALGAAMPTLNVRSTAAERRRDFRHVVGSFLDLVAMNLAGGRGVPEALSAAASVSDGWAMTRIRDTLLTARLHGVTPWSALGELGEELRIEELRDLAAALALVAEDGAKVRESLTARAESLRRRELAEVEGKAGERSQSMLVAQLLLCLGFLVFLLYPALMGVVGGT
ncbi:type II secretion protein F [Actinobacteria bacterium YIM 96077]|uniref:Type II secretion protein F n=1 Tax=Phytoactinopolyspora halophila TaxID=1981511 RepID=A0A329R2G5_9ACTN|nr:type II secretion system F family protein [Phytoactinopolyspora halophila]AYY12214.1 type II secretion protein F [Actinobacteria bacterium YIM 96077]RAW18553.1 type II secretion protein F [Phytoactinopolyspora halophila]